MPCPHCPACPGPSRHAIPLEKQDLHSLQLHGFVDLVVAGSWSEDVRFKIEYRERVSQSEETWAVELAISALFFSFFLFCLGGFHSQEEENMLKLAGVDVNLRNPVFYPSTLEAWGLHI